MELIRTYLRKAYTPRVSLPWPMNLEMSNRYKNDFWITREGQCIYPEQMDNQHLLNTIRIIKKSNPILSYRMKDWKMENFIAYGPNASRLPLKKKMDHVNIKEYKKLWSDYRIYMRLIQEATFRNLIIED